MPRIRSMLLGLGAAFLVVATAARPAAAQTPAAVVSNPAADLSSMLGAMLSEHGVLAMAALEKAYLGEPDAAAAAAQLDENTLALTDSIRAVYGEDAAQAFLRLWRDHIQFFVDYQTARLNGDANGQQQAVANLNGYIDGIATLLAGANPNLTRQGMVQTFTVHVGHLLGIIDAVTSNNFSQAYATNHESHMHLWESGGALGAAIAAQFPNRFPGDATNAAVELRLMMADMLSEHGALAALTLQKLALNAPDLAAANAALDFNTGLLTASMETLAGPSAAANFEQWWQRHIDDYKAYTIATGRGDTTGREAARLDLQLFADEIAALLAGTLPLSQATLAEAFRTHVNQTLTMVDLFAAGQYDQMYDVMHQAHEHLVMMGAVLAQGVVGGVPALFDAAINDVSLDDALPALTQQRPMQPQQRPATQPVRQLPRTGDGSCADC